MLLPFHVFFINVIRITLLFDHCRVLCSKFCEKRIVYWAESLYNAIYELGICMNTSSFAKTEDYTSPYFIGRFRSPPFWSSWYV